MGANEILINLLDHQRGVLARLRELIDEERTCILDSKIERLQEIVEEQKLVLAEQARLSAQIMRLLDRIGNQVHSEETFSLSMVIQYLPEPLASTVSDYQRELSAALIEIQREGRINWYLAQQALKYVDFTLRLISNNSTPQTYQARPQSEPRRSARLLMDSCA
jgi:flagellar biosynthesis/type III secretory pathway chaperone